MRIVVFHPDGLMKNILLSFVLFLLFSLAIHASDEAGDNLSPVYGAITAEALPGISDFITLLLQEESEDFSDDWFINRAQCVYLNWANQVNKAIVQNQDMNDGLRISQEQNWQTLVSDHCQNLPQDDNIEIPDLSIWKSDTRYIPHFPTKHFISEMEGLFSPVSSYVQKMPSYEALSLMDYQVISDIKRRIILETVLFVLGRTVTHEQGSSWSEFFTKRFRTVMSQFHCSRFMISGTSDLTPFQNCWSKQTDGDTQRSNQASTLTDIALGKFRHANAVPDSFDAYGYQPGFAFARSSTGVASSGYYTTGFSVMAETIVFLSLLRGALYR